MDQLHPLLLAEPRELADVEEHRDRVLGGGRKRQPDPALGLQFGDEAPALGGDQRAGAGIGQPLGDVDGSAFGSAGFQLGDDLQDRPPRQRMRFGRRQRKMGTRLEGHSLSVWNFVNRGEYAPIG